MAISLVHRGHTHSMTYNRALDALDQIEYRYELMVSSPERPLAGAMLRFWKKGARYKAVETGPTLPQVLNAIGVRVLKFVDARQHGEGKEEFVDCDRPE